MFFIKRLISLTALLLVACSATGLSLPASTAQPPFVPLPEPILEIDGIEGSSLRDPYGVAIDSQGNIYISDMGNTRVLKFDNLGKPLAAWDAKGSEDGQFNSMGFGGIAVDSNDNVFVVDNGNHRIQKFDSEGNFITKWGTEGIDDGQFVRAIGIAVDFEGNVYVTDDGNPYVQKFDNNGNFIMKWGGTGTGDGQFSHATGIVVDLQGNIFVADYENRRVQKFDPQGDFILTWKTGTDVDLTGIPEGLAVDSLGHVYVTDYSLGRLQAFDNNGNPLWAWSSDDTPGKSYFLRPTDVAFDAAGNIYVVSQAGKNVQIFPKP
jgi:tripartite motif-containing protein 71